MNSPKSKEENPISEAFSRIEKELGITPRRDPFSKKSRKALFDVLHPIKATSCNQCGMCCKSFCLPFPATILLEAKRDWKNGVKDRRYNFENLGGYGDAESQKWGGGYLTMTRYPDETIKWIMEHITPLTEEEFEAIKDELKGAAGEGMRDFQM